MLLNLLTLMTGIVGLITTTIAVLRYKANPIVNKYLILFLSVISIRFIIRGFSEYIINIPSEFLAFTHILILNLMGACFYLHFRDLIYDKKWHIKDATHFIIPLIIVVLFIINIENHYVYDKSIRRLYVILLAFCYIIYSLFSYKLLSKNIWFKKFDTPLLTKQNSTIKNWTLFLYGALVFLGFMIIMVFITHDFQYNSNGNKYQIFISSVVWLLFFIKLLATPELLHGYDFLKIKIDNYKKNEAVLNAVWILKSKPDIKNQKDLKIANNVMDNLHNYIQQIESLSFQTVTFRDPSLTAEDFAKKLNIPVVHLLYIFKYHSTLTFVEYKNMIRIQDAVKLLEDEFLKNQTMESLAKEVGFSSYSAFFKSFKSIKGISPQEFIKIN